MAQTNDGKSDSSVSYTPVAPLNKEEELDKEIRKMILLNADTLDARPNDYIIYLKELDINRLTKAIKTLLDKHKRATYSNGYRAGWETGVHKAHPKGKSTTELDRLKSAHEKYLAILNNKEQSNG